jgi:hypothetical protein
MDMLKRKTQAPLCPFCGQEIAPPHSFDDYLYEYDGGECSCGAMYGFDPTSRNGGTVMMQAIVQACKGDWDKAQDLSPETDYKEGILEKYSSLTHRVNAPGSFGTIYFIRLNSTK